MGFDLTPPVFNQDAEAWQVNVVREEDGKIMDTIVLEERFLPAQYNSKGKVLWKLPPKSIQPNISSRVFPLVMEEYRRRRKEKKKLNKTLKQQVSSQGASASTPQTSLKVEAAPHKPKANTEAIQLAKNENGQAGCAKSGGARNMVSYRERGKTLVEHREGHSVHVSNGKFLKEKRSVDNTKGTTSASSVEVANNARIHVLEDALAAAKKAEVAATAEVKALMLQIRSLKIDGQKAYGMNAKLKVENERLRKRIAELETQLYDLQVKLSMTPPPGFAPAVAPITVPPPGFTARRRQKITYSIQELKYLDPKYQQYLRTRYGS